MDTEEKVKELEEQFQSRKEQKERLEKQIAFHENYIIPTLEPGKELQTEKRFVASLRSDHADILKKIQILQSKLQAEQSREFDFGWSKKETEELSGRSTGGLSVHSSEMKALEIIGEEGGSTTFAVVSRRMRVGYDYARLLCMSLARADYVDIPANGRCQMTAKGEKELEKKGFPAW